MKTINIKNINFELDRLLFRLDNCKLLAERAATYMPEEFVSEWLTSENVFLGGCSPLDFCLSGEEEEPMKLLEMLGHYKVNSQRRDGNETKRDG